MTSVHAILTIAVLAVAGGAFAAEPPRTWSADLSFLRQHVETIVLEDASGARVAVVPAWQGRVMTSTVEDVSAIGKPAAPSFGWLNEELIASGKLGPHMNAFGGEDRLWLGPEGGQFSIFFKPGDPFDLAHWQTPPLVDTEPWPVVEQTADRVSFRRPGRLVNYSGTALEVRLDRTVRLIDRQAAQAHLGELPKGIKLVAFESENVLTNAGPRAWTKQTGLLSLWILGMFQPSPETTVVVPYAEGPESDKGPVVNDAYFGKVPLERLSVGAGVLFFSADGRHRSKIGLSVRRARRVLGSYDAGRGVLTIVVYDKPDAANDYVNSMWEIQKQPFAGDVVNAYNDGPPAPGAKPLGPFYELETSSPAAALAPGQSLTHVHRTFHLQGEAKELDAVARRVLGVGIERIRTALQR